MKKTCGFSAAVAASVMALSTPAVEQTVAYLSPDGSTHSQWIKTGARLVGDARKTCTMEIWIYPLTRSCQQTLITQYGNNAGRQTYHLTSGQSGGYASSHMNGYSETPSVMSAHQVPLNQWSHIALVMNNGNWRIYVNGELDGEATVDPSYLLDATSEGVTIGNMRTNNPNGASNAYYAEARVWTTARTQTEIKALMNVRLTEPWRMKDLIGYWPLNDGAGAYEANGKKVRDYASMPNTYSPGLFTFNYHYADGNRVSWVTSDLPVEGTLPDRDQYVPFNPYVSTNGVNTQIAESPKNCTFMGWFSVLQSANNYENVLFAKMGTYANGRMKIYEKSGALGIWLGGGNGGAAAQSMSVDNVMPHAKWAHVAVVKDGTVFRIYVDGKLVGEKDGFTFDLLGANLTLGGFLGEGSHGEYYGLMKNVGFWRKALKPEAIRELMYKLPRSNESALVGYWPLDDASGNAVRNLKTGGMSAVPIGGGNLDWVKGANMPVVEGVVDTPGMSLLLR